MEVRVYFLNYNNFLTLIEEELFGDYDRLDSGVKEFRFFVNALENHRDENGLFNTDFEQPESFPELGTSRHILDIIKAHKSTIEELDSSQIADPLSLSNVGISSERMNTDFDTSSFLEKKLKIQKLPLVQKVISNSSSAKASPKIKKQEVVQVSIILINF